MKTNRGFIQLVVLLVIGLLVLSYFGFDLKDFLNKDIVKNNLQLAWDLVKQGYNYIKGLIS